MLMQVLSDLHLEVGQQYSSFQIEVKAPYLVLAGDIGRFQDYDGFLTFLQHQCTRYTQVLMVMGNHEFYGRSRSEGLGVAERLQNEPSLQDRFIILNRQRVDLSEDVTVLGCTLQSYIFPESRKAVIGMVQDFARIVDWTVDDHNEEHAKDVSWLRDQITSIRQSETSSTNQARKKIVVITHHAPCRSGVSKPEHENNPWSDAFATDLLLGTPKDNPLLDCDWWLFGHTHYSAYFQVGDVKVFSNQRGYVFPWQTKLEASVQEPKQSKMFKLQHAIKKRLRSPSPRKPFRYVKQIAHAYDPDTTIEV